MTTDAAVLPLAAATDPARCGRKAAVLAELLGSGHEVPDGFVIPAGADCSLAALEGALDRLGRGPYAVRSSGVAEDRADASLAGRYRTVLDVETPHDVHAAAAQVRGSGLADAPLAVLVQRMVRPRAAGVMFTANPVTGDDEVVIEAVRGLGDRLMDGGADADRWVARGDVLRAETDSGVLDPPAVVRLLALARRIAEERGAPQDVEWALDGAGGLHLLQARPITRLPRQPRFEVPPGRWVKDVSHFTGPVTPLGETVLLPAYEAALESVFAEFGLPLQTIRQRAFGGEVYTQDVDVTGRHDPGAPPPWWVLALAVRLHPALRARARRAAAAAAKLESYPHLWREAWRDACADRIARSRAVALDLLDDASLLAELRRVIEDVLRPHLLVHFQLTITYTVGLHELHAFSRERLGWEWAKTANLLAGLSAATTLPTRELAELAARIEPDVLAGGLAAVRATPAGPALDAWIERWGLRTVDVDPGAPMLAEREELVLALLRSATGGGEVRPSPDGLRQATIREARAALDADARARFDALLARAEVVYPQRDDNVVYTEGLPCGLVRRATLEVGRRLVSAGRLRSPGDVAYLRLEELEPALMGLLEGEPAADRVLRRRAEEAWMRGHPGPFVRGPAPVPDPDVRGFPEALRRVMRAVLWAMAEELAAPAPRASGEGALCGVAASPGRHTGPVRLIRTEGELERLRPGDVLVCRTTHSSWTIAFGHAGALVTDGGGMLSHPAIIAREHGIPAVLGTAVATSTLREGMVVTVDGTAGLVELHGLS